MTPPTEDELSDAWQEGDDGGVESLSPRDRDDYLIWDFILGWEMNGLSGHLFNRAPDFDGLRATVAAMRRRGLPELAEIVGEAVDLFARYDEDRLAAVDDVGRDVRPARPWRANGNAGRPPAGTEWGRPLRAAVMTAGGCGTVGGEPRRAPGDGTAPPPVPVACPPMPATAPRPAAASRPAADRPPARDEPDRPAAVEFLARFLKSPRTVGAVLPSGGHLAAAMLDSVDWDAADCVLEFGPGTGPFTRLVPDRLRDGGRFLAVERDPAFAARLRRDLPHVDVACADILEVQSELDARGLPPADAILCGLPWAAFPPGLQHALMDATLGVLAPGGTFATFAYIHGTVLPAGRRLRGLLGERFAEVRTSRVVWRNAPAGAGLPLREVTPHRRVKRPRGADSEARAASSSSRVISDRPKMPRARARSYSDPVGNRSRSAGGAGLGAPPGSRRAGGRVAGAAGGAATIRGGTRGENAGRRARATRRGERSGRQLPRRPARGGRAAAGRSPGSGRDPARAVTTGATAPAAGVTGSAPAGGRGFSAVGGGCGR